METIKFTESLLPGTVRWFEMNHKCGHSVKVGFWVQSTGWGSEPGFRPAHYEALEKQDCPKCYDEKVRAFEENRTRLIEEQARQATYDRDHGITPEQRAKWTEEYHEKRKYK